MKMVGIKKLIHIKGKDFFNLNMNEVALMIDAYIGGGDENFDETALPEFMIIPNPMAYLEFIREKICSIDSAFRSYDELDGLATAAGKKELAALAGELREQN